MNTIDTIQYLMQKALFYLRQGSRTGLHVHYIDSAVTRLWVSGEYI